MKRVILTLALLMQSGGNPIPIPINTPPTLGYGQTYSQDLHVTPAHFQPYGGNGFYTLQFLASNPLNNYPGQWEVEITFGTQLLCDRYGWGTGPELQITEICGSPGYLIVDKALPSGGLPQGQKDLVVTWTVNVAGSTNGGWPIKFDKVLLTFTPQS